MKLIVFIIGFLIGFTFVICIFNAISARIEKKASTFRDCVMTVLEAYEKDGVQYKNHDDDAFLCEKSLTTGIRACSSYFPPQE